MSLIRITQKLQKEIGIEPNELLTGEGPRAPFEEWYAHVFVLNRKKQVIFVETQTLFSFCVENVSRKDIRERLSALFEKGLGKALYVEGASGEVVSKIMSVCRGQFVFAKTESRRTISAVNEFVTQHKFSFYDQNRSMGTQDRRNRYAPMRGFPSGSKKYEFPIDVFEKTLKEQYGLDFTPCKQDSIKKLFSENP